MKDIENSKKEAPLKEAPMLGLVRMGGGATSLMWHHAAGLIKGQLWAWGNNTYGVLMKNISGAGPGKRSSPVQVGTDSNWTSFIDAGSAGSYVSFAAKDDGTLWTSGYAALGGLNQPGFPPSAVNRSSPTQLPGSWSGSIARNDSTIIATKADGTLWTWGNNQSGQLGLNQAYGPGDKKNRSSPAQIGTDTNWSIEEGGLSVGQEFSFAMKQDGTLWVWGKNDNYGFGNSQPLSYARSSPTQIPGTTWASIHGGGGSSVNLAKKTDGTLWAWGNNSQGGLGQNNQTTYSSPKQVGTETTWAGVTVGGASAFVTKTDGTLWTWGGGDHGRLGHNNQTEYSSPRQIPGSWKTDHFSTASIDSSTAAIKADGTLWSWGQNEVGQLGLNQNATSGTYNYSSPKQVGTNTNWLAVGGISATDKNFFALRK